MLSCHVVNLAQAKSYYKHDGEYYTENLTCYDKWHGSLAKSYKLGHELSKEQFDVILQNFREQGKKRAGMDLTFSAPKSISLAIANPKYRNTLIACHQKAVAETLERVELEYIHAHDSQKRDIITGNMLCAEFLHMTARPTAGNDYISDLSLHSHCVILNETFGDKKLRAINYRAFTKGGKIKDLGLDYRRHLAKALQKARFHLELTDHKKGYFELADFPRKIIEQYSSRTRQIEAYAREHGIKDMKQATLKSRESKAKSRVNEKVIMEMVKADLFDSNKIQILRNQPMKRESEGVIYERNSDAEEQQTARNPERLYDDQTGKSLQDNRGFATTQGNCTLADLTSRNGLPELQVRTMDVADTGQQQPRKSHVFLPAPQLNLLAKCQEREVWHYFMRKTSTSERRAKRRKLIKQIDELTSNVIHELEQEKFAFSIQECRHRIQAAGLLLGIDGKEALKAIERAKPVQLGQLQDEQNSKDRYLTTEANLQMEERIKSRIPKGKSVFMNEVLTMNDAIDILKQVENKAIKDGLTDFRIAETDTNHPSEQAQAIYHTLTCADRYVAIEGLAGTGKTTAFQRLKWIADAKGLDVIGACFTGKAADGLESGSGIKSMTIHAFLNRLEKGDFNPSPDSCPNTLQKQSLTEKPSGIKQHWDFSHVQPTKNLRLLVVDEAGLIDDHLMDELQHGAEAGNFKVIFSGDSLQLPPVGAGQPLRAMENAGMATAYLQDIRRQKDIELLNAVKASVAGDPLQTFKILDAKGQYHEVSSAKERQHIIVEAMTQIAPQEYLKGDTLQALLLVSTNTDRKTYNQAIRDAYVAQGILASGETYNITVNKGDSIAQEQRNFSAGDRVIFTANDSRLGVKNGTLGQITSINNGYFSVQTDTGKNISFSIQQYNYLDHSYAVTSYKAQGMTVAQVIADMTTKSAPQSRNALYVDISRAKLNATIYTDNKQKLERQTKDFVRKITSKDFADRINQLKSGITNNDRYHTPDVTYTKALEDALKRIQRNHQQNQEKNIQSLSRLQNAIDEVKKRHPSPVIPTFDKQNTNIR